MASTNNKKTGTTMLCLLLALGISGCGSTVGSPVEAASAAPTTTRALLVTTFGAKGDGTTDDAPAIQRALNAAAPGALLTFPCGQFSLGSVAGTAPGTRSILYLNAAHNLQIQGAGPCTHIFTSLAEKSVFEFEDSTSISLSNLKITALNAPYVETYGMDGGSAIRFTGVTGGSLTALEVDGASAGSLYLTKGTSGIQVAGNTIHDTYGAAIWEDDCGAANAHDCSPSTPPHDNTYTANTLTNVALDALAAISFDDGNGFSHSVAKGNTVSWTRPVVAANSQVHCIQINNASYVDVLDNSCTGTPWDGIVITTGPSGHCQNVTLQGNTIRSSGMSAIGGSGIVVYDAPKGQGITAVDIEYNTISNAGDDGIRLYAASKPGNIQNGQIKNNTVSLADQHAPGSHFGIDIEYSASISASSNTISCDGKCIAVGVNVNASPSTTPTAASNQVTNILGAPLAIH